MYNLPPRTEDMVFIKYLIDGGKKSKENLFSVLFSHQAMGADFQAS